MQLTRLDWVKTHMGITGSDSDTILAQLIPQVSQAIARVCHREFETATRRRWTACTADQVLFLPEFPVTKVLCAGVGLARCMTIEYSDDSLLHATATVLTDQVELQWTDGSGVLQETTLDFATYATLSALATQINTLANWTAEVTSGYESYPTTWLFPDQTQSCVTPKQAELKLPGELVSAWLDPNFDAGLRRQGGLWSGMAFVYYEAGYTLPEEPATDGNLPADLVLVANELVKDVYDETTTSAGLESEKIGDYSYKMANVSSKAVDSAVAQRLDELTPFRNLVAI